MNINRLEIQNKSSFDIITKDENDSITQRQLSGDVQAYAKLEFEAFSFYVQTLQVIIGRKASKSDQVDVHIGSTKAISRQHAKLFYDFTTQRFEIFVMGKNGAFVNEQFIECGRTIPLYDKTKIQIGKVFFTFLLPNSTGKENNESKKNVDVGHVKIGKPEFSKEDSESSNNISAELFSTCPVSELESNSIGVHKSNISLESSNIGDNEIPSFVDLNTNLHNGSVFSHNEFCNISVKEPKKPNLSYASLIAQAILSSPTKKMTLSDIYEWITDTYKYYKYAQNGWQNSIRHSLSLNKAFKKVFRKDDEPGKGSFWTINSEYQDQFKDSVYKQNQEDSVSSQYFAQESSSIIDSVSLKPLADPIPITIMQDGQLTLNPEYFSIIDKDNNSSKIQIVQIIVLLQRYIITQLGPHARNPQNAAAIANALIVALDQQLQKQKSHRNFISTTFKNLISIQSNTDRKAFTSSNEFLEKNEHISELFTPLTFFTQIPQNTRISKMSNSSIHQSYSMNDKLISKKLYPIQVPPPPPYYLKSQTSNVTNHLLSSSAGKNEEFTQNLSSKDCSVNSLLRNKQGPKRSYEDSEETLCFTDVGGALSEDNKDKKLKL
ncbi:hypothetical protein PCANB_002381 [Pneumocystis canis]|nr:hypothetical protein PCK1_002395 [Pneumocystis canis]KAG5439048.1 hypothetical protein PCANB_002381 [Pneumocystis canis]